MEIKQTWRVLACKGGNAVVHRFDFFDAASAVASERRLVRAGFAVAVLGAGTWA